MRFDSLSLVCRLLTATLVVADDELEMDEDDFHCYVDQIFGQPSYLCNRNGDGESKQFAFRTTGKDRFHRDDFVDRKAYGGIR